MPQLVCTMTPRRCSMRSISAGGNGAPPTMMRSSVGSVAAGALQVLDQVEPDGGDADGDRHGLADDQRGEARAVGLPAGQHELRAGGGQPRTAGPRRWHETSAPTASTLSRALIAMHVGLQQAQRVQEARTMRVGDALRRARRARGEAQAARRGLVEAAPGHLAARLRDQRLERATTARSRSLATRRRVDQQQRVRSTAPTARSRAPATRGRRSTMSTRAPRLRDHRGELLAGEARIERVADRAHAHDRVPDFDVRLRVPRQRRDAVAGANAEACEHAPTPCGCVDRARRSRRDRRGRPRAPSRPRRCGCHFAACSRNLSSVSAIRLHRAVDHRHCAPRAAAAARRGRRSSSRECRPSRGAGTRPAR